MVNFTIQDINSAELKNFFNIFGFVKISGLFSDSIDVIDKEFDISMDKRFGKERTADRNYFYPQFIEYNEYLTSLLEKERIITLVENLLGKDPIFTGSDGNIFAGSTPWHRDYLFKQRSLKMLFYLDSVNGDSGALRVIPGSHFVEDKFSAYLGDALTWPEPPFEGGFDEKGFFGKGHNPTVFGDNTSIPNYVVNTNPGDVIVFNHNIIHCTNYASKFSFLPKKKFGFRKKNVRRMFGMHFFSNPSNISDPELAKEVDEHTKGMFRNEMREFKQNERFGPFVHNSKSKSIQKLISHIKDLKVEEQNEVYDGVHDRSSQSTIDMHNSIKPFKYNPNQETN